MATTVWAILAEMMTSHAITGDQKLVLFGFYAPYLIIPALLAGYMALTPLPFPREPQSAAPTSSATARDRKQQ